MAKGLLSTIDFFPDTSDRMCEIACFDMFLWLFLFAYVIKKRWCQVPYEKPGPESGPG
ncbi:MAG: hypothetical protein IJT05_00355 [Lachnospiraceae bacterium]|nr:hypothetical protein [Lachnospiraceae bacterium]